jgi:hypothetical protein
LVLLGFDLRAEGTLPLEPLHQTCFVLSIFMMGLVNYWPGVGFEQWSSWSLPPEWLGL